MSGEHSGNDLEWEVCAWLSEICGDAHVQGEDESAHDFLKSGQVLCDAYNIFIRDESKQVKKIHRVSGEGAMKAMKMRENITNVIKGLRANFPGVAEYDLFSTNDLFEAQNMGQFYHTIWVVGGQLQLDPTYDGPVLGRKYVNKTAHKDKARGSEAGQDITGDVSGMMAGGLRRDTKDQTKPQANYKDLFLGAKVREADEQKEQEKRKSLQREQEAESAPEEEPVEDQQAQEEEQQAEEEPGWEEEEQEEQSEGEAPPCDEKDEVEEHHHEAETEAVSHSEEDLDDASPHSERDEVADEVNKLSVEEDNNKPWKKHIRNSK